MKSGAGPTRLKHTDFDYIKSHHPLLYAGVETLQPLPAEFFTKNDPYMPNQDADDRPFGCTTYGQALLKAILRSQPFSKVDVDRLEAVTHANALGGYDIRKSLDACLQPDPFFHPERLGWFTQYYNIRQSGNISAFNAFRLAQISGRPEQRAITSGIPWFPSWEAAANGNIRNLDGSYTLTSDPQKRSIMPMPTDVELAAIRADSGAYGWHNSDLDGWTTKNGILLYRDTSFQGTAVGDGGYIYFTQEVINVVMAIDGTVAFTATRQTLANPLRVDLTAVQWVVSFVRSLLNLH